MHEVSKCLFSCFFFFFFFLFLSRVCKTVLHSVLLCVSIHTHTHVASRCFILSLSLSLSLRVVEKITLYGSSDLDKGMALALSDEFVYVAAVTYGGKLLRIEIYLLYVCMMVVCVYV